MAADAVVASVQIRQAYIVVQRRAQAALLTRSCVQFLIQISILPTLLSTSSALSLRSSITISSSYDCRASSNSTSIISESRFSCSFCSGSSLAFNLSYSFVESVRSTTTRSIQLLGNRSHACQSIMWPPWGSLSSKVSSSWHPHQLWHLRSGSFGQLCRRPRSSFCNFHPSHHGSHGL